MVSGFEGKEDQDRRCLRVAFLKGIDKGFYRVFYQGTYEGSIGFRLLVRCGLFQGLFSQPQTLNP